MMTNTLTAIVPAAGTGLRATDETCAKRVPKQYRPLAGRSMLRRAVEALLAEPRVREVRVAVAPGDVWVATALAGLPRTVWRFCGGATRADTVRAALEDADWGEDDWVLVHDAARPGLPLAALQRLIDACWTLNRGGLLALPVVDTVKQARPAALGAAGSPAAVVETTLPRDSLWLAQTPQMFPALELIEALQLAIGDPRVTDEASAVEAWDAHRAPLLVRGAWQNAKLTWPEDFAWFEHWLQHAAR